MKEVFVFAILSLKKSFSNTRTAFDLRQICSPWGNNQTTTLTLFKSFGNTKIKQKSSQRTCTTTRLLIPTHTHTLENNKWQISFLLTFQRLSHEWKWTPTIRIPMLSLHSAWENMPHTCFFLARERGRVGLWHLLVCSKLSTNHVSFGKMSWRSFCLRLVFFFLRLLKKFGYVLQRETSNKKMSFFTFQE